ncbi:MAG: hypothetical protein Q9222_006151 [Ikaeria aurantiellina]
MSDKKRKRAEDGDHGQPKKRAAPRASPTDVIKVSLVPDDHEWAPIVGKAVRAFVHAQSTLFWKIDMLLTYPNIASTPGLTPSSDLSLNAYKKARKTKSSTTGTSHITTSEHLLHTSQHAKLDYVASEEETGGKEGLLSHYIGVYNPQSRQLQLVPARKLVLRGAVRPTPVNDDQKTQAANGLSARSNLRLTFGTKKSQRAIQDLTKNAISPSKPARTGQGQASAPLDPIASAVVSSMAATSSSMPSREDLQTQADESHPRPQPNLEAEKPADVYPVDQVVGSTILRQMAVKTWQEAVTNGEEILTKSRFVSHRVQKLVEEEDVRRLKTLKYLLLLLEWYGSLLPASKRGGARKIPDREKLREKLGSWGSSLVDAVADRFSEGGRNLSRWHLEKLIMHICALTMIVDGFTTDVSDIKDDLRLENKEIGKYFREIGARVAAMTESEGTKLGLSKAEAKARVVARLKIPLEFPKMRVVKGKRR